MVNNFSSDLESKMTGNVKMVTDHIVKSMSFRLVRRLSF